MIRYIHGSADSTDPDVIYVVDTLPALSQAQAFYREHPGENCNFIVVREGTVFQCLKGHPDEVNNALLRTYPLHPQTHPLLIRQPVIRDVFLKDITMTRKILSPLTRTHLRPVVKEALRGSWQHRLEVLASVDLTRTDLSGVRSREQQDLVKSMVFSLGQAVGLHDGAELYTKADIAGHIPALTPYLYRQPADLDAFQQVLSGHLAQLARTSFSEAPDGTVTITRTGTRYDIHREIRLEQQETAD